ncbi:DNA-3-methyladenine glycosylase [Erysiphe necator]|nr:DNA-3-methyladenine glycosylase [Erysiphe necator]
MSSTLVTTYARSCRTLTPSLKKPTQSSFLPGIVRIACFKLGGNIKDIPVTTIQVLDKADRPKHSRSKSKETRIIQSDFKRKKAQNIASSNLELSQIISCNSQNTPIPSRCQESFGLTETITYEKQGLTSPKRSLEQCSKTSELSIQKSVTDKSLIQEANTHLIRVEPKLKPIIEQNFCHLFSPEGLLQEVEPFGALTNSIISQQVSSAAAKSIKKKFISLFNQNNPDVTKYSYPTPSLISTTSIETLRTAGLTQRKAEYIKGLAAKFESGELSKDLLFNAPYEEIFNTLIKVRGLGKWSIEMFACFCLKRTDIFSTQDIGIQRGMAILLGRDIAKLRKTNGKWKYITEKEMENIARKFSPYRSIFMWYVWRIEEMSLSALED